MHWTVAVIASQVLLLIPLLALVFAGNCFTRMINRLPLSARLAFPAGGAIPYYLVTHASANFRWWFFGIYAALPVVLTLLLWHARLRDPAQHGDWRDFLVLFALGLIVEFRLLDPAWPAPMRSFNRLILLDTALYGFLVVRQLSGVGFNLVPRLADVKIGLRELAFYAPIAVPLGLRLHFLHLHAYTPSLQEFALTWLSIFAFVALLEEAYFRGLMQNLFERRIGRRGALVLTAVLFGLSHFNKGATSFNWRYVLLATIAGIFYGRAWRLPAGEEGDNRRVIASTITHAFVDTIWAIWLR